MIRAARRRRAGNVRRHPSMAGAAVALGAGLAVATLLPAIVRAAGDDRDGAFPAVEALPVLPSLPDPLEGIAPRDIASGSDAWRAHRQRLLAVLLHYEYGSVPPSPGRVDAVIESEEPILDGKALDRRLVLLFGPEGAEPLRMRARLVVPERAVQPCPVVFKIDMAVGHIPIVPELVARGYAAGEIIATDLDPDRDGVTGPAQAAYPDHDWATLAAWAWGAMRMVDYLCGLDAIDPQKIAVTGHSRTGKAALLAGVLDQRIALVAPNGSGCGGAGSFRITDAKAESLEAITRPERFGYWFHPRLRTFAGFEDRLPFDQHFLRVLIAPRAVLATEGRGDRWANPIGSWEMWRAAQPVFDQLGVGERNAIRFRDGGHDQTEDDWMALLWFAENVFRGVAPPDPDEFRPERPAAEGG